jgi:formiminotetrahydrofolate cyclodeaminase
MEHLLERVGSDERTPAAGSAAAASAALGAALVAKAARRSRDVWPEAGGAIAQTETLQARLTTLAAALEASYAAAIEALQAGEADAIADRLPRAAEDSLQLAMIAADVAELAAEAGHRCNPAHHADVSVAARLAHAAAWAGAHLVDVNLLSRADDPRSGRARLALARAHASVESLANEQ